MMTTSERLLHLQTARDAAQAVLDEITHLNDIDPVPTNVRKRLPVLRRARNEIADLDLMIGDIDGDAEPVSLDAIQVEQLDILAARLNDSIRQDALTGLALESLTRVLQGVQDVRVTLS
jgi:hypothetical protein